MSTKFLTPAVRRWVYGVAIATFAVLVFYGVIKPEASPLLAALVLAILNVSNDPDDDLPSASGPGFDGE